MKPQAGRTESLWIGTADVPSFEPLKEDISAEVCIIGAGISGITTAYLLARDGHKDIVVLDDNTIAGGATSRTTAHLSNVLDDRYQVIERTFGKEKTLLAYESHTEAINQIERNVMSEDIDCDFKRVDGYLFCDEGQSTGTLDKEFKICREIGFDGIEMLESTPFGFKNNNMPCIRFPRQAQIHILKYLSALVNACVKLGVRFYTWTHVNEVKEGNPNIVVTANGANVKAAWVVAATNSPITDYTQMHLKQSPWRTYVVAGVVPVGAVQQALFWDLAEPYHYIRTEPIPGLAEEWLIVGGEDHRTGHGHDEAHHLEQIEKYAREMFPSLKTIDYRWSGQVLEPADGMAFIGRDPEHKNGRILLATGDSGMGMTHGTIAGMLLRDMITGVANDWESLYDPARWPIKSAVEFVVDNIEAGMGYAAYLSGSQAQSVDDLEPGQGAVFKNKGQAIAACRDENGKLCQFSAVCPHLKAELQWNALEQTWDCPAHGSRFTADGTVVNGPAITNMAPVPEGAALVEPGFEETRKGEIGGEFQPGDEAGDQPSV